MLIKIIIAFFGGKDRQYNLGLEFERKGKIKQAFYWYRKSAFAGSPRAQCNLGGMYYKGIWVKKNYHRAFQWFSCSAFRGQDKAYFNLGLMYMQGQGVNKNKVLGIYSFKKAATLGNEGAKSLLKQIKNDEIDCGTSNLKQKGLQRDI